MLLFFRLLLLFFFFFWCVCAVIALIAYWVVQGVLTSIYTCFFWELSASTAYPQKVRYKI